MSSKFMFLFEIKVLEKQLFHSFEFYNCLAPLCSGLARGDGTFGQFDLNIYTRIYLSCGFRQQNFSTSLNCGCDINRAE